MLEIVRTITPGCRSRTRRSEVSYGSMLSKNYFEGVVDAILIQSKHQTRKIDSRSHRSRFGYCESSGFRRLFRQMG
jgi:hypothetical protein